MDGGRIDVLGSPYSVGDQLRRNASRCRGGPSVIAIGAEPNASGTRRSRRQTG